MLENDGDGHSTGRLRVTLLWITRDNAVSSQLREYKKQEGLDSAGVRFHLDRCETTKFQFRALLWFGSGQVAYRVRVKPGQHQSNTGQLVNRRLGSVNVSQPGQQQSTPGQVEEPVIFRRSKLLLR
ncbi:hypothetical protein Hanom_Chr04g00325391 [Helianthus anomalus]